MRGDDVWTYGTKKGMGMNGNAKAKESAEFENVVDF